MNKFLITLMLLSIARLQAADMIVAKPVGKKKAEKKTETKIERINMVLSYGTSQQVRDILKQKVARMPDEEQRRLIPGLRELTKSKDVLVQAAIARLVARAKFTELDMAVAELLKSDFPDVEGAVLGAIERKQIQGAVPILREKVKNGNFSEENQYLPECVRMLGEFKDKQLADLLFTKVKDETVLLRYRSVILTYFGKADVNKPEVVKHLRELVKDDSASLKLRPYAASSLGRLGVSGAGAELRDVLKEIDEMKDIDRKRRYATLRLHILSALVRLKDSKIVEILLAMARDDDSRVRLGAIRQLGELREKSALKLLEYKSKYDPDGRVKKAAKKAIEAINGSKT